MKKTMRRAIAVTTAGAAGLAGAIAFQVPAATAAEGGAAAADERVVTNLGMAAWGYGSHLLVDGLSVKTARTAYNEMACTRFLGAEPNVAGAIEPVLDALPQEVRDLIDIDLLRTVNQTYREDGRTGSRSTSTVGDIVIGGGLSDLGIPLPKISIKGLTSTADAFFDGQNFGTEEDVTFDLLDIDVDTSSLPPEVKEPVDQLLGVIDDVQSGLAPVTDLVDELVNVTDLLGEIPLPGLGSIELRGKRNAVNEFRAISQSYAMAINIDPDGPEGDQFGLTRLKLGRAYARTGGPVYGGVFRSYARAFKGSILDGILPTGALAEVQSPTRSIPCEGTQGKVVKTPEFETGAIVDGLLVNLSGVNFELFGKQERSGRTTRDGRVTQQGWAKGMIQANIDEVTIPAMGLTLKDLVSRVGVNNRKEGPVRTSVFTDVADVLIDGVSVQQPAKGEAKEYPTSSGGTVILKSALENLGLYHGGQVLPMRISLLPVDATDIVDVIVGQARAALYPKA